MTSKGFAVSLFNNQVCCFLDFLLACCDCILSLLPLQHCNGRLWHRFADLYFHFVQAYWRDKVSDNPILKMKYFYFLKNDNKL